jgi:hypothetical protein
MDPNVLPKDEHLTEKQLRLGYWFVTHKLQMRQVLTVALFVLCVGFLLFTVGMLIKLYIIEDSGTRRLERTAAQSLVNPNALKAALPKALTTKPVEVLDGGQGRFDTAVLVANPNDDFWAEWDGRFSADGATTTAKTSFILPGETKTFVDLGVESTTRLRNVRYEMGNLRWHRLNRHEIPEYARFRDTRVHLDIQNVAFTATPSLDGKSVISRVSFSVTNRSSYSYWSVRFLTKLFRGTSLAAVNAVELQQLSTGQTRQVEVVWVQDLAAISKVEVVPEINIFDRDVYMAQ